MTLALSAIVALLASLAAYRRAPSLRPAAVALACYPLLHAAEDALASAHRSGAADAAWQARAGCLFAWPWVAAWLCVRVTESERRVPLADRRGPQPVERLARALFRCDRRTDCDRSGEHGGCELSGPVDALEDDDGCEHGRTLPRLAPPTLLALVAALSSLALALAWRRLYPWEVPLLRCSRVLASVALPIAWGGVGSSGVAVERIGAVDQLVSRPSPGVARESPSRVPVRRGRRDGDGCEAEHEREDGGDRVTHAAQSTTLRRSLAFLRASASRPVALALWWGAFAEVTVGIWARADPAAAWWLAESASWVQWCALGVVVAWAAWRGK